MNTPSPFRGPNPIEQKYITAIRSVDSIITTIRETLSDKSLGIDPTGIMQGSLMLRDLETVHETLTGHRKEISMTIKKLRGSASSVSV